MTNKTDTTPAHDCAEEIAEAMYECHAAHYAREIPDGVPGLRWSGLTATDKAAWIGLAKAMPNIIINHAGRDLKERLARLAGSSTGWRKYLYGALAASVLWLTSLLCSCSPVTPDQVRQWDEAHALMHRVTGTDCTLCNPTATSAK